MEPNKFIPERFLQHDFDTWVAGHQPGHCPGMAGPMAGYEPLPQRLHFAATGQPQMHPTLSLGIFASVTGNCVVGGSGSLASAASLSLVRL